MFGSFGRSYCRNLELNASDTLLFSGGFWDFGLEGWKQRNSKLEGCSQEGIHPPQNGNDSQMAQFQIPLTNCAVCELLFIDVFYAFYII